MNKTVRALSSSNYWSSSENSATNAWNINFQGGTVNNNNNKNNSNVVRAVAALGEEEKAGWIEAFADCCRHKMSSDCCTTYRMGMEEDLLMLACEVYGRTYKPSVSTCFVVTRPRIREIFAANFRDRIVQHWMMLRITPLVEERFSRQGNVSFNCRKGFGTLSTVDRLKGEIARVSDGYAKEAYVGKFDIQAFFMSIDKDILLGLLIPFIRENYKGNDIDTLVWVTEVVVRHCPQKLCEMRSPKSLVERLPRHKSLMYAGDGTGMPIGNISSQILANFYLSFFDDMMLEACMENGAGYVRFADDFVVVSNSRRFITNVHKEAARWLYEHLKLTLHPDKAYIQEVRKGVKFVGSVIKPGRAYTDNRTIGKMKQRIWQVEATCSRICEHGMDDDSAKRLERGVCSLNSYMGFMCRTASYGIRRKMFAEAHYFWRLCYMANDFLLVKIKSKYRYRNYLLNKEYYELELRKRKTGGAHDGAQARTTGVHGQRVY